MATLEGIDLRRLELPWGNTTLEQYINLCICATFGLRQAKEDPYDAAEASAAPKEGCLCTPGPRSWVELIVGEYIYDSVADIIADPCEYDGFGLQPSRRYLGNEGVADRADCKIVDECENEKHDSNSPCCRSIAGGR